MNNKEFKFEITPDNIMTYLMQAATRQDIAELRKETKEDIARLDNKIDQKFNRIIYLQFGTLITVIGTILTVILTK